LKVKEGKRSRLDHVLGDVVLFLLADGRVVVGRAIGLQRGNLMGNPKVLNRRERGHRKESGREMIRPPQ
jgi:hypothetical protein